MITKDFMKLMMRVVALFWGLYLSSLNCVGQTTGQRMVISVRSTAEEQQAHVVKIVDLGKLRLYINAINDLNEDCKRETVLCSFVLPNLIAKPESSVLAYAHRRNISLMAMKKAPEKIRHRRHIIPIRSIKALAQRALLMKIHYCVLVSMIVLPIVVLAITTFLLRN